jgi:hypothetical protein
MSTSQSTLLCDSSTLTNFKAWAMAVSSALSSFGWTLSSDTGQVNWSSIAAVPGSAAWVYEVWQPNDGLTNFYLKVEYGNTAANTNSPGLRLTLGTGTNGAGTLTGFVTSALATNVTSAVTTNNSTPFECDFSGAAGRFSAMLWRNGTGSNMQQLFTVERSLNSSGTYTSTHVTLLVLGTSNVGQWARQQSIVFGVGASPVVPQNSSVGGLLTRPFNSGGNSYGFNNSIPFDLVTPCVGFFDYPLTTVGAANAPDVSEGVTFTVTVYGSSRTYMPAKTSSTAFANAAPGGAVCMRYD